MHMYVSCQRVVLQCAQAQWPIYIDMLLMGAVHKHRLLLSWPEHLLSSHTQPSVGHRVPRAGISHEQMALTSMTKQKCKTLWFDNSSGLNKYACVLFLVCSAQLSYSSIVSKQPPCHVYKRPTPGQAAPQQKCRVLLSFVIVLFGSGLETWQHGQTSMMMTTTSQLYQARLPPNLCRCSFPCTPAGPQA
jgi:hypothetical protein